MGKRYIDPEAFFKVINTLPYKDTSYPDASAYNGAISDVADMLAHFPAADVAEVVRCKDCKYRYVLNRGGSSVCNLLDAQNDGEAYCSYGERKDG